MNVDDESEAAEEPIGPLHPRRTRVIAGAAALLVLLAAGGVLTLALHGSSSQDPSVPPDVVASASPASTRAAGVAMADAVSALASFDDSADDAPYESALDTLVTHCPPSTLQQYSAAAEAAATRDAETSLFELQRVAAAAEDTPTFADCLGRFGTPVANP